MSSADRDLRAIKEEVRARADLVELVSQYTRLRKAGKNWTGLCPFHADKRPSFSVSAERGFYKCFSCGESGDIFTFVQKKEGLDFIEALEMLAQRTGVPFTRGSVDRERASEREEMLELNLLAVRFFQDRLARSQAARQYLTDRAVLVHTQEQFQIGCAPDDWEALVRELEKRHASLPLAAKLGLIRPGKQDGGYYDAFRNRLMFPIQDVGGRVVGFGGRTLGDDAAKYLNSEQSALFDKSSTLYGLNFARKAISGDNPAVFVEGYLDVITTHQAGFPQCIATLGTAMTEKHARLLARYNARVVLCYDSDAAGIKATLRAAEVWESLGVEGADVRVARLPEGDDPDSLLRRGETAEFQAALDDAVQRARFELDLALGHHDLATQAGRESALEEVVPILASVTSLAERSHYVDRIAHLHPLYRRLPLGQVTQQILRDVQQRAEAARRQSARAAGYPLTEELNRAPLREASEQVYRPPDHDRPGSIGTGRTGPTKTRGGAGGKRPARLPAPPPVEAPALTGTEKAERQILRALFTAEWRAFVLARVAPENLATPLAQTLFIIIARTPADETGAVEASRILEAIADEPFTVSESDEPDAMRQIEDSIARTRSRLVALVHGILQDSISELSNEPLNDRMLTDCIRKLEIHRQRQAEAVLRAAMENAEELSTEERKAYAVRYHEQVRRLRGSPERSDDYDPGRQ